MTTHPASDGRPRADAVQFRTRIGYRADPHEHDDPDTRAPSARERTVPSTSAQDRVREDATTSYRRLRRDGMYRERSASTDPELERLARRSVQLVERGMCVLLDGGTTTVACARSLPAELTLTIVSPSPAVAMAAQANGHEVILVGGRPSELGGIAVGSDAERQIDRCAADLCLLGACGVHERYGLGADDHDEAAIKRAMLGSAARTAVITSAGKIGQRSRHRVASPSRWPDGRRGAWDRRGSPGLSEPSTHRRSY